MTREIRIGERWVGDGHSTYIVAECGINHNGDINIAKQLIDVAIKAGADAVKFQKREPEVCVPRDQWDAERDTPWGRLSYIDYRHEIEFWHKDYEQIAEHCYERIDWFTSAWDLPSLNFMRQFTPVATKIPSAKLTNDDLVAAARDDGLPVILSTGMSTMAEIGHALEIMRQPLILKTPFAVLHCTSEYPCPNELLNLRMIDAFRHMGAFEGIPIGYSGHEVGLATSLAAVAMGACILERHITLDRAMWGTDQSASVEPQGLVRLVKDIRAIESAMGDGKKVITDGERQAMRKLRGE